VDTDDLTEMAYQTIALANVASDCLKTDIGVLSHKYETEDDYLKGILGFVQIIKDSPEDYLESWNILETSDIKSFSGTLKILENYIKQVLTTPIDQRGNPPEYA
jgi:hypothetical protein